MKNGFYGLQVQYKGNMPGFLKALDNIEAELPISINKDGDLAVVSVGSFLQGFCGELAKYFNRECGLPIGILCDSDGIDICLLHVFNVFTEGSTTYYLDAAASQTIWPCLSSPFWGRTSSKSCPHLPK